jgi:hypothetical protein
MILPALFEVFSGLQPRSLILLPSATMRIADAYIMRQWLSGQSPQNNTAEPAYRQAGCKLRRAAKAQIREGVKSAKGNGAQGNKNLAALRLCANLILAQSPIV